MKSITSEWFECKIRYEKIMEDGLQKKVTELYTVDALSFAEAETRIIEEASQYISGEFEVTDIKKAKYKEIFFSEDASADRWYKSTLEFITINEKTSKEQRSKTVYLVNASTLKNALNNIDEVMGGTMIDYSTFKVEETPIMDVFDYHRKNDGSAE